MAAVLAVPAAARAQGPEEPFAKRVARLIEQLGDEDYAVREQAQEALAEIGFPAYDALTVATRHDDLEIASRARYLVRLIRVEWVQEGDPPEVKEILEDYEVQDAKERESRMRNLANLSGGAGVPALCRLVRFEQSEVLSKHAAIQLLQREPPGKPQYARWSETVRDHLAESPRTAAGWLVAAIRLREDPAKGMAEWSDLVQAEQAVLGRSPGRSDRQILTALLYRLASAQAEQGNMEEADATAARARELFPIVSPEQLFGHLETAYSLRRQGMIRWAEQEYRMVADVGVVELTAMSMQYLAEMLHDQGKHEEAAKALGEVLDSHDPRMQQALRTVGSTESEFIARRHYFQACHWEAQGETAKQREELEKALAVYPAELDVLIASFRLSDGSPEERKKISGLIDKAAAALAEQIKEEPDEDSNYNQYAWLVGNTTGDKELALKFAQKAVEISPDSAAFRDTLAHVHYGMGEWKKAVDEQERAVELEPHSGLIREELDVFRKALEEHGSDET